MAAKRTIRFKERVPSTDTIARPTERYLRNTDGSLPLCEAKVVSDKNGFLLSGNNYPGDRRNIAIIGDSFVEALYAASDTKRWVSVAEAQLERSHPGAFRLLNGGYSGMTSLHQANLIPNKIRPLMGSLSGVVLFVPHNDAKIAELPYTFWSKDIWWSPVEPHDHSGDLIGEFDWETDIAAHWDLMLRYLNNFEVPILVVGTPYRIGNWGEDPFLTSTFTTKDSYKEYRRKNEKSIEIAISKARELGIDSINWCENEFSENGTVEDFYDLLHLNPKGQEHFGHLFGEALAEWFDNMDKEYDSARQADLTRQSFALQLAKQTLIPAWRKFPPKTRKAVMQVVRKAESLGIVKL